MARIPNQSLECRSGAAGSDKVCCLLLQNFQSCTNTDARVCLLSSPPPSSFAERRVCVNLHFAKNLRFFSVFIAQKLSSRCQTSKSRAPPALFIIFKRWRRSASLPSVRSRHSLAPQPTDQSNTAGHLTRNWVTAELESNFIIIFNHKTSKKSSFSEKFLRFGVTRWTRVRDRRRECECVECR